MVSKQQHWNDNNICAVTDTLFFVCVREVEDLIGNIQFCVLPFSKRTITMRVFNDIII